MQKPEQINKIVFLGTPEFAASILQGLLKDSDWEIAAVFTQPDRASGRSGSPKPSAVKEMALRHKLRIFQPRNLQDKNLLLQLKAIQPDLLVVAAYGLLLPKTLLEIAPYGALNVHASLLPKYRGAAPIQRALLNNEQVTGASIMQMQEGLDNGPVLLQRAMAIGIEDTAQSLHNQLAQLGQDLLLQAIKRLQQGTIVPVQQDDSLASYAPKLQKAEGNINWHKKAFEVHNHIRAMYPWPGAFTSFYLNKNKSINLVLYPGYVGDRLQKSTSPGTLVEVTEQGLAFACQDRLYLTPFVKPSGKKKMDARAFKCGYLTLCP